MAFEFSTRNSKQLCYPTVHVHDGDCHDENVLRIFEGYDWFYFSREVAEKGMKLDQCQGLVAPNKKIYAMSLLGRYPNCDLWLGDTA